MSRILVAVASAALFLTVRPVVAQDDLGRILERDKIAAQKLRADVDHVVTESRALEKTNPSRAADLVQDMITKVRNGTELPAEERVRLLQRLQTRLRDVNTAAQERARAEEAAARRAEQKAQQETRQRQDFADRNAPPPQGPANGPASIASKVFQDRNNQLNSVNQQKNDRTARNLDVLTGLQKTATPIDGVVEFPKHWDRIAERGKQKLSDKEVAMLKALNSVLSVDFDKMRLSKVFDLLQDKAGLTILIDEPSLKDANVDLYEDTVTFKVNKVTVRTILRKILADRGLGYVLKDGMVQVLTQEKARNTMVVRAYPVSDLVAIDRQLYWGPIFSRALMLQNAQRVIDMIVSSVEPSQWNTNGGQGSITFHEGSMSLVIRASAEMHYMLGGSGMVSR